MIWESIAPQKCPGAMDVIPTSVAGDGAVPPIGTLDAVMAGQRED
jgi:hypothetical protein